MPLSFVVQLQQELRLHSPHIVPTLSRVSRCQKHADASVASETGHYFLAREATPITRTSNLGEFRCISDLLKSLYAACPEVRQEHHVRLAECLTGSLSNCVTPPLSSVLRRHQTLERT